MSDANRHASAIAQRKLIDQFDSLLLRSSIYGPADALRDTWQRLRSSLLAAPESGQPADQWQPIATAPRDTEVLTYDEGAYALAMNDSTEGWIDLPNGNKFTPPPSHWMPLTPPGAAASRPEPPCTCE